MLPIRDETRRRYSVLAVASLVAGIATLPLTVRSAAIVPSGRARVSTDKSQALERPVEIRRDPFRGDPSEPHTERPRMAPIGAFSRAALAPIADLPAVSALVVGAHPFALLEDGGVSQLRTLGDRVGNHRIVAITLAGVRLDDGSFIALASGARSPVPAAAPDILPAVPIGIPHVPDVRGDTR
jgi:hypothetical protein